jgi:alpha,alpha-trehalase
MGGLNCMSSVPISAHALVSDCHSAALVTADGSVDWRCFPRFDSPSVFGRLLDDAAGHWSIRPAGEHAGTRRYADRTLVLETTFRTPTGTVTVTDALALGADNRGHALGRGAPHLLIRSVAGVEGEVDVEVSYQPRPEYGLLRPLLSPVDGGVTARGGAEWLVLSCPVRLALAESTATTRFALRAGETVRFALHRSTLEEQPARIWSQDELADRLAATVAAWRSWSDLHPELRRAVAGPGAPQRPRAAGSDVPAQRRYRRCGHHVVAGGGRGRTQLGLPVLVGARRELHDGGLVGGRLPGRGE